MKEDTGTNGSVPEGQEASGRRIIIKVIKALAWIAGIWLCILLAAKIVLTPSVLDRIIDKVSSEYVDGKISVGRASVSVFRHFPSLGLQLDSVSITYPATMFDEAEASGPRGHLASKGLGKDADTLASFERFSVGVNLMALVRGKINIPYAELVKPRIFVHRYQDGRSNLDMIRIPEDTSDKESAPLPEIKLGRIRMSGHPHIVYTDRKDTIFAMADLTRMNLNGRLDADKTSRNRIGMRLDSLFVAGRISRDTLAFGIDRLGITEEKGGMRFHAKARTLLATRAFGRIDIPLEIRSAMSFPKDSVPAFRISGLDAEIASVPVKADADLRFRQDRLSMNAALTVDGCRFEDIIDRFLKDQVPEAGKIRTDASFSIDIKCDGDYMYADGKLPDIDVKVSIPESVISHKDFKEELTCRIEASANTTDRGKISVSIDDMAVRCEGADMKASASIDDVLESDFLINLDGHLNADIGSLTAMLPEDMKVDASGRMKMDLKGSMRPSHLSIYTFSQSALEGSIEGDSLRISSPADSLDASIRKLDIHIGPEDKSSKKDSSLTFRMLSVRGNIDGVDMGYGTMALKGDRISLTAMNSTDNDTTKVNLLGGRLNAAQIVLTDAEGMELELKGTENGFQMLPKKDRPDVPVLTLTSVNDRIMLKDGTNRIILTDAKLGALAAMNTVERRIQERARRDSAILNSRRAGRQMPQWMEEDDFRKQDIDIKLDETMAKYFREWDLKGSIDVRTGIMMTPYFPLRNILRGLEVSFDNDRIGIDSIKVRTGGASEIGAKGEVTGLRRALLGRGGLKLDLELMSDKMDANEILTAFNAGSRYAPPQNKDEMEQATDAEFFKMVTSDTVSVNDSVTPLIVIPANLNADIRLNTSNIRYSNLDISSLKAKMTMKERCVQLTETAAVTNMGNASLEGFYASRSKRDIRAGFSFNLEDITAEKVIEMMPRVDTLMPMLKSFNGKLDCEIAATADIDTNMNIIAPSINGILRIEGKDLTIKDNEMFMDLAKKLKFKNREEICIENMSVEGVISDSMLEVFPFLVKVDRYTLALSGIHNMDESFKYHASVLRSPLLIRLGIDLYGDSLDQMKFRIGKAKYKSTEIPVFSAVIDTTKINLVNSIRNIFEKGVDAAISENSRRENIEKHKREIGYVRAVDQELEALSEREKKQMDAELKEEEPTESNIKDEQSGIHRGELPYHPVQ